MPPREDEPRARVTEPTIGEYKGHATLTLPMPNSRKDFTFGLSKAKAILANPEAVKKFVESEGKP